MRATVAFVVFLCSSTTSFWWWGCLASPDVDDVDGVQSSPPAFSTDMCPLQCNCSAATDVETPGLRVQCKPPEGLTSMRQLEPVPLTTVELDLSGNQIEAIEKDDMTGIPLLESLSLRNNFIETVEDEAFANQTTLLTLDLSGNRLSVLNASMFIGLTKLTTLNLADNKISRLNDGGFHHLFGLQTLDLSGNELMCDCRLKWIVRWTRKRNVVYSQGSTCKFPDKLKDRQLKRLKGKELHCNWPPQTQSFEINPAVSQVVFQGDRMLFRCHVSHAGKSVQLVWLHNGQEVASKSDLSGSVIVELQESPDGSSVSSSLLVSPLMVGHTGIWGCVALMPRGNKTRSVSILVISEDTKHCPQTVTANNKGRYLWPKTVVGVTVELSCEGQQTSVLFQQPPHAFYTCGSQGTWTNLNTSQCPYISEVTKVLEQFSKTNLSISSRAGVVESARRLRNYTDGILLRDKMDIVFIARTVENYLVYVSRQKEIGEILIDVVSTVMRMDKKLLRGAQIEDKACTRLIRAVEQLPELVTDGPLIRYRDNIAVEEFSVSPSSFFGMTCTSYVRAPTSRGNADHPYNEKVFECKAVDAANMLHSVPDKVVEASIQLPASLFQNLDLESTAVGAHHKIQFTIYRTSKLFPHPVGDSKRRMEITTSIISSRLAKVTVTNLTEPVVVMLRAQVRTPDITPVWWDFMANGNFGDWSSDGCTVMSSQHNMDDNLIVFKCHHLANFGLLQDVEQITRLHSQHQGAEFRLSHPAIYIGSCICICCLLVVIVTYLCFCRAIKMPKKVKHSLLNTWLAIVLLCFLFTIGVYQTKYQRVCQAMGLLLHYVSLCTLFWMMITISNMYKKLTKTRNPDPPPDEPLPPKPMLRFYLVGWGIAIIICGISGAVNMEEYAGYYYCFLAFQPSLGAFYGPVGALVFFLCVFFCLIHCYINSVEGNNGDGQTSEALDLGLMTPAEQRSVDARSISSSHVDDLEHPPMLQLRAHAVVLLLFLLTWASAAIATARPFADHFDYEEAVFSCIYSLLSSVLGGFILIFFCLSRQDVWNCWKRLGHCRRWREVYDTGLATQPPLTSVNGHVRQSTNSLESSFTNKSSHTSRSLEAGSKGEVRKFLPASHPASVIADPSATAAEIFYNPRQNGIARRFFEKNRQHQLKLLQQRAGSVKTDNDISSDNIVQELVRRRLHPHRRSIDRENCVSLLTMRTSSSGDHDSHTITLSQPLHVNVESHVISACGTSPSPLGSTSDRSPLVASEETLGSNPMLSNNRLKFASGSPAGSAQVLNGILASNRITPKVYVSDEPLWPDHCEARTRSGSVHSGKVNIEAKMEPKPIGVVELTNGKMPQDSIANSLLSLSAGSHSSLNESTDAPVHPLSAEKCSCSNEDVAQSQPDESSLNSYAYVNHSYQQKKDNSEPLSDLHKFEPCANESASIAPCTDCASECVMNNIADDSHCGSVTSLDIHSNIWLPKPDDMKLKKETSV